MKKLLSFLTSSALAFVTVGQTPRIIVQGSGAPQVFTDFALAIAAANATNVLYMSGGDFSLGNGTVYIDHEVHIVGAGFHPDSAAHTLPTRLIDGTVRFHLPASNCSVTGVHFSVTMNYGDANSADQGCTGMLFARCYMDGGFSVVANAGSSTTFDQCFLLNDIGSFSIGNSVTVHNSICNGDYSNSGIISYDHCFIFGNEIGSDASVSYQDCVLARTTVLNTSSGTYSHCLLYNWTLDQGALNVGCIISPTNPFVNSTNFYPAIPQYGDDLHLAAGNPGIGAATDGTDIGLYGGSTPLKPGFVPYNPHYLNINIAGATNANGELPVNITVARQTN